MVNYISIYIVLGVLVFLYGVLKVCALYNSLIFLKKNIKRSPANIKKGFLSGKNKSKVIILMPVLREQEIILSNLNIFTQLKGDYELVYITTEKEYYEKSERLKTLKSYKERLLNTRSQDFFVEQLVGLIPGSLSLSLYAEKGTYSSIESYWGRILEVYNALPNTAEIIDEYLCRNTSRCGHVRRIHYPYREGVMAHQLNYACKELSKFFDSENSFIIIYNADSTVGANVLDLFYEKIYLGETVIMQSALFLSNYDSFSSNFRGSILKCVALLQSKWTIIHEIQHIRTQYNQNLTGFYESAHVVGHGSCIRLDTLLSVGGYPEKFVNEDLPLGYFLSLSGRRICLLPVLENAQSHTSISSVITQYTTWFYGAIYYFKYYRHAVDVLNLPKSQAFLWACVNYMRAIIWLCAPLIWGVLIIVPILSGTPLISLLIFAIFWAYNTFVCWLITYFVTNNPEIIGRSISFIPFESKLFLALPIAYVISGIGPIKACIKAIRVYYFGGRIMKAKTER